MAEKKFIGDVTVRDSNGNLVRGKHYRRIIDASDDDGKDFLTDDVLELEDGRIAFRAGVNWQDEEDSSSVFEETD